MGFIKQTLLVAFFAWLLVRIIVINKTFRRLGFGIPVFNHNPGPCKLFHEYRESTCGEGTSCAAKAIHSNLRIAGIANHGHRVNGSEDIDVLPNGLAIFSSGMKVEVSPRGMDPAMQHYKGMLYTFDLNKAEEQPKPLPYENFDDSAFVPHGIDFYIDPKTHEISLFVVNHGAGIHSIEIFQFDQANMVLKHRKTVVDEKIYSPNDVVAVGPDSFYTINDLYYFGKSKLLGLVEGLYPLELGNVVFYNGSNARFVADHFKFADGINIDASGRYVFVVDSLGGEVVIFERTDENNLIERQRFEAGIVLDNINIDENGDLWLGVSNIAIFEYGSNFTIPCPGAVLQVKLSKVENGNVPFKVDDIREVFSNSGDGEFKCVASASFYRGKLLVGNPFSNLMYCEVLAV